MQSLAGNKYVPRLGVAGCESDGQSTYESFSQHNSRVDSLHPQRFRALDGEGGWRGRRRGEGERRTSNWASLRTSPLV